MPRLFDLSTATGPPNSTDPSWCGSTQWRPLTPMSNPVSIATALASSSAIGRDLGPFPPSSQESQASAPGVTDARMKQVRLNIARPLVEAHQRHRARQRKEKLREHCRERQDPALAQRDGEVGQIGLNVSFRSRIPTAVTGAQRNPDFDWAAFSTMFQK
jgi:hypothetical protein